MLQVSLLGQQVITDAGTGDARATSSRALALIAFLAVRAGSPQARQRIAGLFWPESADAQALTNLRRELHHLRQLLGDDPSLVVTARDLCWRDTETVSVDVRAFDTERLAALAAAADDDDAGVLVHAAGALAAYRGEFLPGSYEDWLLDDRAELELQCVALCELLSGARARSGDLPGAVQAARRRVQLQPLAEAGYRTLMELQADLGDRAGAVSTYHHCASVLERELGVEPDPATRAVFERLTALTATQAQGQPHQRQQPRRPAGRSGPAAADLVGRSAELAQLRELWHGAAAGRAALAVVRGAAGVGKTRLAAEIARMARRDGAVVTGSRCFGASERLALAPVADWLRDPAVRAATARLDPGWRAEVDRLVPTGSGGERRSGPRAMVDAWERHRFFEGLARALLAVGRPMLLVVDNLQWCDQETLAFLAFCLGLAPRAPLLVAGTLRDDDASEDHELTAWITQMRASGLLTELTLSPLEAADTARLAESVRGRPLRPADTSLLQAATGGFPLYVIEAMRGGADTGGTDTAGADPAGTDTGGTDTAGTDTAAPSAPVTPGDLAAVLRNRLDQATPAAREVAGLAAAVGTNFTLDLLTEASDLDSGVVVGAVDELWRQRIMREFRDGYDFSHDLLRETAYAQVSPPRRWLLHRRVAQGLELLHADDTDLVSAQLAQQYARGGRPDRAVDYYRRAADVAAGRFAHAEAIRLHRQALDIVASMPEGRNRDQRELSVLEGMAAPLNARYGYASPVLQEALERSIALAQSLGRRDSTLTGLVALWTSRVVQGRTRDGYEVAARALRMAGDDDSQLAGLAHFAVGGSALTLGMAAEGLRHLELAASLASDAPWLSVGTRQDVHGTAWAAHAHWLLGHDDEALRASQGAIALAREIGHPYTVAVALAYGSMTRQMRGDLPELRRTVSELRELCDRYSFAYYREWALILDGWSRDGGSGLELARRGIANLRSAGAFARMPYWLSLMTDILTRNGRTGAARATLDAALAAGQARDDLWWLPELTRMRAGYDDDQAAIERLRSAARMASAHGSAGLARRCERDLAARTLGERRGS